MLDITPHKVAQVVLMTRELDRAEGELRGFIDALSQDEQESLVALMWIGRGVFEPEDLEEAIDTAARAATTPAVEYLLGTPHVSDHLEAGLEALGQDVLAEEDALVSWA